MSYQEELQRQHRLRQNKPGFGKGALKPSNVVPLKLKEVMGTTATEVPSPPSPVILPPEQAEEAPRPKPPSMRAIVAACIDYFKVAENEMYSLRRKPRIVLARHIAMYLGSTLTNLSYPQIGKVLDRDHSTCMHGIQKIADKRLADKEVDAAILYITNMLKGQANV